MASMNKNGDRSLRCLTHVFTMKESVSCPASTAYLCRGYQMPTRSLQSLCTGMSQIPWIVQQWFAVLLFGRGMVGLYGSQLGGL